MGTEYTPGPWEVEDRRGAPLPNIRIVSGNHEIAKVSDVHMRNYLSPHKWTSKMADELDEHGLANAALIAAAPDLLAACEAFVRWDESPHNTERDAVELRRMMVIAIARARATSPPA